MAPKKKQIQEFDVSNDEEYPVIPTTGMDQDVLDSLLVDFGKNIGTNMGPKQRDILNGPAYSKGLDLSSSLADRFDPGKAALTAGGIGATALGAEALGFPVISQGAKALGSIGKLTEGITQPIGLGARTTYSNLTNPSVLGPLAYGGLTGYNVYKDASNPESPLRKAIETGYAPEIGAQGGATLGRSATLQPQLEHPNAKTIAETVGSVLGGLGYGTSQGASALTNRMSDVVNPASIGAGTLAKTMGEGIGNVSKSAVPLTTGAGEGIKSIIDSVLGTVQPLVGGITDSKLGKVLTNSLAMSEYAPAWNDISTALTGKGIYPSQGGMTLPQGIQPEGEPVGKDYFNIQTGTPSKSAQVISEPTLTQPWESTLQGMRLKVLENIPVMNAQQQAQYKMLLDARKEYLNNQKTALDTFKSQKERSTDIGNYTSGSEEHKHIIGESNALKKMDAVMRDLDSAASKGDWKTVAATGQELLDFLRVTTNQAVTEDQRKTLNPMVREVEGFLKLFQGTSVDPRNLPVLIRSIKAIRSELETDLHSYIQRPNSGIKEGDSNYNYLFNNRRQPTGETTLALKDNSGNFALAHSDDGKQNYYVDPKTLYPYVDIERGLIQIVNNKGESAGTAIVGENGELLYSDSKKPVDSSKHKVAEYEFYSPSLSNKIDAYGFQTPDEKTSISVPLLTATNSTTNSIYKKHTEPYSGAPGAQSIKDAQEAMWNRWVADANKEGQQRATIIEAQMSGGYDALKKSLSKEGITIPEFFSNKKDSKIPPPAPGTVRRRVKK